MSKTITYYNIESLYKCAAQYAYNRDSDYVFKFNKSTFINKLCKVGMAAILEGRDYISAIEAEYAAYETYLRDNELGALGMEYKSDALLILTGYLEETDDLDK